jgi:hypothetical protein
MPTEDSRIAAGYALDCIANAEDATRGAPPDPDRELAKAQVYATLAVAEVLERIEQSGDPVFTRD